MDTETTRDKNIKLDSAVTTFTIEPTGIVSTPASDSTIVICNPVINVSKNFILDRFGHIQFQADGRC